MLRQCHLLQKVQSLVYWRNGELDMRFCGHKYDIKRRPDNCDLAKHCRSSKHDLEKDLGITIIEHGIQHQDRQRGAEDKYICKLQTFQGSGIDKSMRSYGREIYTTWKAII